MTLSAFNDKAAPPADSDLQAALHATGPLWNELIERVTGQVGPLETVWGFTSKKTGWGMRLKLDGRIIMYMTPCEGHFLVSFVLGEKAVRAAEERRLPKDVIEAIKAAPKYAEGRGVRFQVRTAKDLAPMEALAVVKVRS